MADSEPETPVRAVVACAERTLAARSARIEFRHDFEFKWPETERMRPRRQGGLLRPAGKVLKKAGMAAGTAAWRRFTKGSDPGHTRALGVIEPARRRHMVDLGSYAEVYKDGRRWGGRSGRRLSTLDPWPPDRRVDILWLLDVLRGTTTATVEGDESLRGTTCRRIAARVDLEHASAAVDGGLKVPSVERFEDLRALPITVWIDDEHVRRVRFEEGDMGATRLTLDLWDFDVPTDDLDWDRLPTFRSPGEAALVAAHRRQNENRSTR